MEWFTNAPRKGELETPPQSLAYGSENQPPNLAPDQIMNQLPPPPMMQQQQPPPQMMQQQPPPPMMQQQPPPMMMQPPMTGYGMRDEVMRILKAQSPAGARWDCVSDEGLDEFLAAGGVPWAMRGMVKRMMQKPSWTLQVLEKTVATYIEGDNREQSKMEFGIGFPLDVELGGQRGAPSNPSTRQVRVEGDTVHFETISKKDGKLDYIKRTLQPNGTLITHSGASTHKKVRKMTHRFVS